MAGKAWTQEETVLALALYLRIPYETIQKSNPLIAAVAADLGRSVNSLTLKLWNFGSLDGKVWNAGLSHVSNKDLDVWEKYVGTNFNRPIDRLLDDVQKACDALGIAPGRIISDMTTDPDLPTEREITRTERRNQNYFRQAVLQRYCGECLITGLRSQTLIEVAHIVPWYEDSSLRLVPSNGLTLNPLMHRAYDSNLIGIDADMVVHVSPILLDRTAVDTDLRAMLKNLDGRPLREPPNSKARPNRDYLARHFEGFLRKAIPSSAFI